MSINIHNKTFEEFIPEQKVIDKVKELANQISAEYKDKKLLIVAILNGSFMFASDLMKNITIPCEISFVKVSSYKGLASTGRVDELIGLNVDISDKDVLILEDIVDTGITMNKIYSYLKSFEPNSIQIASFLFKPDAFEGNHKPEIIGFSVPNYFVVGYGLDYNELGRNYPSIYKVIEN